jgi:Fic family protein
MIAYLDKSAGKVLSEVERLGLRHSLVPSATDPIRTIAQAAKSENKQIRADPRPRNAVSVPPPPEKLMQCMGNLEKFLHDQPQRTPVLIKSALGRKSKQVRPASTGFPVL